MVALADLGRQEDIPPFLSLNKDACGNLEGKAWLKQRQDQRRSIFDISDSLGSEYCFDDSLEGEYIAGAD